MGCENLRMVCLNWLRGPVVYPGWGNRKRETETPNKTEDQPAAPSTLHQNPQPERPKRRRVATEDKRRDKGTTRESR